MKKPDITKTESGLEQNDGLAPTREPSFAYQDGSRINANDIGMNRSEHEDKEMNEAMSQARDNRRDQLSQNSEADLPTDSARKH